jgi:hypothetical protein
MAAYYTIHAHFKNIYFKELGYHSPYSDWLRAGRPRGWSSSPGRVKNFLFSTSSRPALGPTQPPIQWVAWALSLVVKRQGRKADHSPICLYGVVLNWLSTGTTLPFTYFILSKKESFYQQFPHDSI